jgi:hypothetical protein
MFVVREYVKPMRRCLQVFVHRKHPWRPEHNPHHHCHHSVSSIASNPSCQFLLMNGGPFGKMAFSSPVAASIRSAGCPFDDSIHLEDLKQLGVVHQYRDSFE